MKRYTEIVEVDDNGNRTVISSEEMKKFSPKKAVSDFAEKHPKVVKAAKITGLVILAGGAALLGVAAVKGKNGASDETIFLSDDDLKLLADSKSETEAETESVPEVSE